MFSLHINQLRLKALCLLGLILTIPFLSFAQFYAILGDDDEISEREVERQVERRNEEHHSLTGAWNGSLSIKGLIDSEPFSFTGQWSFNYRSKGHSKNKIKKVSIQGSWFLDADPSQVFSYQNKKIKGKIKKFDRKSGKGVLSFQFSPKEKPVECWFHLNGSSRGDINQISVVIQAVNDPIYFNGLNLVIGEHDIKAEKYR